MRSFLSRSFMKGLRGCQPLFQRIPFHAPQWMKSSAVQQGLLFGLTMIVSLVLMAAITLLYVDHELEKQNREIVKESRELVRGKSRTIDDDPIDDDDVLEIMTSGFILSGLLALLFTSGIVTLLSRYSQKRISRIEHVLNSAAEGDLSARTGEDHAFNDLARISQSVDEMLSRLEGSVASLRDISANIAHELKTPITRLRHNLLTLQEELLDVMPDSNGTVARELNNALEESARLASIFDALLRISQIESGARRSRFALQDLNTIVDTVAEIYSDVAEDAGMSLINDKQDSPVTIMGDRELLIQQVANLIENSLRYCPEGSVIRLRTGADLEHKIAWLKVQDNGPGISEIEKERVFERMYRVNKSRTDGGLGLGLSLAKAISGLHHGSIELQDQHPGLGVVIRYPRT